MALLTHSDCANQDPKRQKSSFSISYIDAISAPLNLCVFKFDCQF